MPGLHGAEAQTQDILHALPTELHNLLQILYHGLHLVTDTSVAFVNPTLVTPAHDQSPKNSKIISPILGTGCPFCLAAGLRPKAGSDLVFNFLLNVNP